MKDDLKQKFLMNAIKLGENRYQLLTLQMAADALLKEMSQIQKQILEIEEDAKKHGGSDVEG